MGIHTNNELNALRAPHADTYSKGLVGIGP